MIIVKRILDKNSFGGATWEFMLLNYYKVKVNETNDHTFVIELFEPNWINFKRIYSFSSRAQLGEAISDAFDEFHNVVARNKNFNWTIGYMNEDKNEVLRQLRNSQNLKK